MRAGYVETKVERGRLQRASGYELLAMVILGGPSVRASIDAELDRRAFLTAPPQHRTFGPLVPNHAA